MSQSVWADDPGSAKQEPRIDLREAATGVVELTNKFREKNDLSPLATNPELGKAAQQFAEFMARTDKYGHHADGKSPAERAQAAGYQYCVVRENIAYRTDSRDLNAEDLANFFTEGWIDSAGHRENMLAEFVTDTAVAIASNDGLTFYAVQMFGRPDSASFKIELTNNTTSEHLVVIESNNARDKITLPPRARLKIERCFPTTLLVAQAEASIKISESNDWELVQKNGAVTFSKL